MVLSSIKDFVIPTLQTLDALGAIEVSRAIDKSLLVTFDGYLREEFKVTLVGPA